MSTATLSARPTVSTPHTVRQLGWLYAKRFARHPLFLLGVVLCGLATGASANDANAAYMVLGFYVAFFIGVTSLVVAYRLTRMTDRATEMADAAPAAVQARTAALLWSCLVPAAAGAAFLPVAWYAARTWPPPDWVYAGFGGGDIAAMFFGQMVVAPLGAAALGVAAGRWLRFPGAIVLLVLAVVGWVLLSLARFATDDVETVSGVAANAMRQFSPVTFFVIQTDPNGPNAGMLGLPGSPIWYAAWQLLLCALAATAALFWRAERGTRKALLRAGGVLVACAAIAYVLALTVNGDGGGIYRWDGTVERAAEQ